MGGFIAALIGTGASAVLVVGGVTTYQAVTVSDTQKTDPTAVGYADE